MPLVVLAGFTIGEGNVLSKTVSVDQPALFDTTILISSDNPAVTVPVSVVIPTGSRRLRGDRRAGRIAADADARAADRRLRS